MKNEPQKPATSRVIICDCGGELRPAHFDVYDFSDYVGLKVTVSDIDGFKCTKCGGETIDGAVLNMVMNYTITQVAKQPRRLGGAEVRYLRRSLHATQEELAHNMGINRVTLADWERGDRDISPEYDYMLRGFALGSLVEADLIKPDQMREILGTVFKAVRHQPPTKRPQGLALPNLAAMKKTMLQRGEMRDCA